MKRYAVLAVLLPACGIDGGGGLDGDALDAAHDAGARDASVRVEDAAAPDADREADPITEAINALRAERRLPRVPWSPELTRVAELHVLDLEAHFAAFGPECNGHSWSDDGPWSGCCYTDDHAEAECMWHKPAELSAYPDFGFEIMVRGGGAALDAQDAMTLWLGSPPHLAVILSEPPWDDEPWQALGGALSPNFGAAWFGKVPDPSSP